MKAERTTPALVTAENHDGPPPEMVKLIQARAHELFEQRGREEGHDLDDWLQAEREVTQASAEAKAA